VRATRKPEGLLDLGQQSLRFHTLIGTGGIGTGTFFLLRGNHTLGREESRSGRFLDRRDYCKLHIVCHYVKALLGKGFTVFPIGRVGDDGSGRRLLEEMREVDLRLGYVDVLPGKPTLYSFCFLYPDGSGGNMTTEDSASGEVSADYVGRAEGQFKKAGSRGIALAVPEVPLQARAEVLELAGRHGLFRVASFTSGEMESVRRAGLAGKTDLLALNQDEARSLAGLEPSGAEAAKVAEAAVAGLSRRHPDLLLSVTAGAAGSWSWDGRRLLHLPAVKVPVATTGGAGDAHLAGVVAGVALGLPLSAAHGLGVVLAAASVTSPHTIHKAVTRACLADLAERANLGDEALLRLVRRRQNPS
jgi:sugar/nucleoside kinase (ribokinase family)